jgi:hypothetical protein
VQQMTRFDQQPALVGPYVQVLHIGTAPPQVPPANRYHLGPAAEAVGADHASVVNVNGAFSARPVPMTWLIPGCLAFTGGLAAVAFSQRPDVLVVAGLLLVVAAVSAVLVFVSRIDVAAGQLSMTFRGFRRRTIHLYGLRAVTSRRMWTTPAPALELLALDGTRLEIRLGTWQREEELLAILDAAARTAHAKVDSTASEILRDRPTWRSWTRRPAGPPTTPIGRATARLPRPIRWVVSAVVFFGAVLAIYAGFELADRFSENVLFPRRVDAAWVERFDIPIGSVDTWVGNVAITGDRMALAARADIAGFWGTVRVWTSSDNGRTWSSYGDVSGKVNAARHVLVASPDGTLTAAWAERGPAALTQRLVLRRSTDGAQTWLPPITVAAPSGGTVGLPVLVMTPAVHLIAYTDGVTGEIWAQPLTRDGHPLGSPARIDVATRQLYTDAPFTDGGLALDTSGNRAVLAYVAANGTLRVVLSDDGGATWRQSAIEQPVSWSPPRLATDGATFVVVVGDPDRGARYAKRPFFRVQVSHDGGATWTRGPSVSEGAEIGRMELVRSAGVWRLLYEDCPGFITCATPPRVWYRTSLDAESWTEPSAVTEPGDYQPVGIAADPAGVSVIWATVHGAHDWSLVLSRRNDP